MCLCLGKVSREWDFLGGAVDKNLPAYAGDTGAIPGLERLHMPRGNSLYAANTELTL